MKKRGVQGDRKAVSARPGSHDAGPGRANHSFKVNGGLHTKGDCVVIHHGDIEAWVPLEDAVGLGKAILATAAKLKRENAQIRRYAPQSR